MESRAPAQVVGGRYKIVNRELGSGAQGTVCAAVDTITNAQIAAKLFRGADAGKQEAALMRRCAGHKHVAAFIDYVGGVQIAGNPSSVLLMELVAGGDLFDRLISGGAMTEEAARHYLVQLMHAVAHCHARGVAHRDIKLENVLIDLDGHIKLTDFGLAGVFRIKDGDPERLLSDRCGSKAYVAPELIADRSAPYVGPPVDVWACGVCLFAMLANFFPFDVACARRDWRMSPVQLAQAEGGSTVRTLYELASRPCPFSAEAVQLLDRMLALDPARRATVAEVLDSPWVRAAASPFATPAASLNTSVSVDGTNLAPTKGGAGASAGASVASGRSDAQNHVEVANEPLVDDHDPSEVYRDVSAMVHSGSHAQRLAETGALVGEEGVYRSAFGGAPDGSPAGAAHVPHLRRERAFERWSTFESAYDADMVVVPSALVDSYESEAP